MKNLIAIIAAATVTSFTFGSHAQAAGNSDVPTVTVRYSLRDVRSEGGIAALYDKIAAAAGSLCQGYQFGHSPAQLAPYRRCVKAILVRTISSVDLPELNAYAVTRGVAGALTDTHRHS